MSHLTFTPADQEHVLNRMADLSTQLPGKGIVIVLMATPVETSDGVEYQAEANIFKANGVKAEDIVGSVDVFVENFIQASVLSGELTPGFE